MVGAQKPTESEFRRPRPLGSVGLLELESSQKGVKSEWPISVWAGGALGIVAAPLLSWLLVRGGTQWYVWAGRPSAPPGVSWASWALFGVGVVVAAVVWGARRHPLVTGIPAGWLLLRFMPALLGTPGAREWYPEWVRQSAPMGLNVTFLVVAGVLAAATFEAYIRRGRAL